MPTALKPVKAPRASAKSAASGQSHYASRAGLPGRQLQQRQRRPIGEFVEKHQVDFPLAILSSVLALHGLGVPWARGFFALSHPSVMATPGTDVKYGQGVADLQFVFFYVLQLTCLRALVMRYVLGPLAAWLDTKAGYKHGRFQEQGWIIAYNICSWSLGISLLVGSPYYSDTKQLWIGYPHMHHSAPFKIYYLISLSFWLHQILVLLMEKPRKDFYEMGLHHLVTVYLISSSYYFNLVRVGHAILCVMDLSDILLGIAKCANYADYRKTCDAVFATFVVSWIQFRFYYFCTIVLSVQHESWRLIKPEWDPARGIFASWTVYYVGLAMLWTLMGLMLFWFWHILRVLAKVFNGTGADDTRSDDEADEDCDERDIVEPVLNGGTHANGDIARLKKE